MGEKSHLDVDGNPRIVERRFTVAPECAGMRLDVYLKQQIPRLSRTKLQRLIKAQVTILGRAQVKANSLVRAGDKLIMRREAQPEPPCPRTFKVLYEDARVLVIDKPAGLPVHASAKFYFNTLTRVLSERYPDEAVQICHRLDRETSGALVCARDRDAARILKGAFETKRIRKTYWAIVHGVPPWEAQDVINAPLILDPNSITGVSMTITATGSAAETRVRLLRAAGDYSLIECQPITGRQHQIRAHLAHVNYPIVGDKLYTHGEQVFIECCDRGISQSMGERLVLPRHALHARTVTFPHPDGHTVTVDAPYPADLQTLVPVDGEGQTSLGHPGLDE